MIDYKELIAALRSPAVFISDGGMADGSHVSQQAAGTIEALTARVAELENALAPFAKAGELFDPMPEYDMRVYGPAAGDEFSICGKDLYLARDALKPKE